MSLLSPDGAQWQRNLEALRRHAGQLLLEALGHELTIEVMLNPDGRLWQERLGEEMKVIGTMDRHKAEAMIRVVASTLNQTITPDNPILDNAEFPLDGSRFSAALPPVVSAPIFCLRRRASKVFSMADYVASRTMTEQQKDVLCRTISEHKNIIVIGGTSSGKTTLTNALIGEIVRQNPKERIFIFEDTQEIQCNGENALFFHTTDTTPMSRLLMLSLRMRPDRICVGEVRNAYALDLMDCWNTGHDGGVATIHATNAERGLSRLASLISRNPFRPAVIEEVIGESVQRIVFIKKTPEGRRIQTILGVDGYAKTRKEYEIKRLA